MPCRYPGVPCFWADPLEVALRSLRVVDGDPGSCPSSPWGYHHAKADLPGEHELEWSEREGGRRYHRGDFAKPKRGWPKQCTFCDHSFGVEARRYTDVAQLYRRADSGELPTLRGDHGQNGRGPAGLLTHSEWMPFVEWTDRYGDGINLLAVCPNGAVWHVDGPATSNTSVEAAWQRSGDPRNPETLTVSPSIVAGDYHGWLQGGRFTDDLGS